MTPFPIREGQWVLRAMMREAGVDPNAPESVQGVWEVFKRFVQIPSKASGADSDGILYESGRFDFYGPDEFFLSFVRQFEVTEPDGQHDHYEQLRCEFRFAIDERVRQFEPFEKWWFVGGSLGEWDEFVRLVEARPEMVELALTPPQAAAIEQEAV